MVRWTLTAFAAYAPALALLQLLHGLTFGATHLGAMHFLGRSQPDGRAATAQALYASAVGIGQGLLMLLAGVLYGALGGRAFLAMAAVAAAGAALALLATATKS